MSDDLRLRLRMLEEDYAGQPVVLQRADLPEINRIRAELGMPLVDARLKEVGTETEPDPEQEEKPGPPRDHSQAKKIYEAYLKKVEELELHRAYARRVAQATSGAGQTPVYPLATMGTNGGPLLCDLCRKPIVLEGEQFHGVSADAAWARHPNPNEKWRSWILGGLVVEIAVNGTLRIYHGYPGRDERHCCNAVIKREKKAPEEYEKTRSVPNRELLVAFLEDEFPRMTEQERDALYVKIADVLYTYDPGLGVNRPAPPKKGR